MSWVSIIELVIAFIGGGGLISLFTIGERKRSLKLENEEKEDSRYAKLVDELQDQVEKQNERLDKKDARITELEDTNAELRQELDNVRSELVRAKMMRCSRLACKDRKPPFGYLELTPEELMEEKSRLNLE